MKIYIYLIIYIFIKCLYYSSIYTFHKTSKEHNFQMKHCFMLHHRTFAFVPKKKKRMREKSQDQKKKMKIMTTRPKEKTH